MNLKVMRNMHLYLGVFFSPLLIFFIVSGCLQTYNLHEEPRPKISNKPPAANTQAPAEYENSYVPPPIIVSLSQVHKNQRWTSADKKPKPSEPFRILILLMSIGMLITTILGIVLAFKYTKPWSVWLCLFLGTVIPCFMIWLNFQ